MTYKFMNGWLVKIEDVDKIVTSWYNNRREARNRLALVCVLPG